MRKEALQLAAVLAAISEPSNLNYLDTLPKP